MSFWLCKNCSKIQELENRCDLYASALGPFNYHINGKCKCLYQFLINLILPISIRQIFEVLKQRLLKSSKFTSRRNWRPTDPHLSADCNTLDLGRNRNPFNDLEKLELSTLEVWDKCASNLKIIMKAMKYLCWDLIGSCIKIKWFH